MWRRGSAGKQFCIQGFPLEIPSRWKGENGFGVGSRRVPNSISHSKQHVQDHRGILVNTHTYFWCCLVDFRHQRKTIHTIKQHTGTHTGSQRHACVSFCNKRDSFGCRSTTSALHPFFSFGAQQPIAISIPFRVVFTIRTVSWHIRMGFGCTCSPLIMTCIFLNVHEGIPTAVCIQCI